MTFQQAISAGFSKYATFEGRSTRSEYWYFVLFLFIVGILTSIADEMLFSSSEYGPIGTIFNLATFIPAIAAATRRLHDTGRSGWWQLLYFTIIGAIVVIVWQCQPSEPAANKFDR
ncbi:DUF805 domain-containing protein [soil metagenome]